ncbi:MAG TPA: ABC transporter permease [Bacilli bacterium]|nr:ABC transporter permease [Bacilli bacterium]
MEQSKKMTFGQWAKRMMKKNSTQTIITSIGCAVVGLLVGFVILLCINPNNAFQGILQTIQNFFAFKKAATQFKYFGLTLAKTAPLICTSLAILFAYKTGLFNIGASGQYVIGVLITCFAALAWRLPWYLCILLAMTGGALWGGISGLLKAYFNVNEVISGIMLNWIALYLTNALFQANAGSVWDLMLAKTYKIDSSLPGFLPTLGLDELFKQPACGLGMIIAPVVAIIIFIILNKTTFGYELKATGHNRFAAEYAGMKGKRNTVITMCISGALAALAAPLFYLNGLSQWEVQATVPALGFDGISASFLGGLSPIGSIFSAYFITHIIDGGSTITSLGYSPQTAQVITSFIIYLCAFVPFVKSYIDRRFNIKEMLLTDSLPTREETQQMNSHVKKRDKRKKEQKEDK